MDAKCCMNRMSLAIVIVVRPGLLTRGRHVVLTFISRADGINSLDCNSADALSPSLICLQVALSPHQRDDFIDGWEVKTEGWDGCQVLHESNVLG